MTGLDLDQLSNPQVEALVSFLCPLCDRRLNVPKRLAGIAGPCPSCQRVIRAPQVEAEPPIIQPRYWQGGADEVQPLAVSAMVDLPTLTESQLVPPAPAVRFSATKRIPPTPAEGLDETWREKVERQRKRRRKRRRRARLLNRCLEKGRASRKLGILLLLGIIGVTVGLLYLNHRSGGQLLGRGLGH